MNWMLALFALNFSLLLLHEMDAIRAKEWKMFIFLKDMKEQTGYCVFALVHLPLYFLVIYLMAHLYARQVFLLVDGFLIVHAVIHFLFRKHAANGFHSAYSNMLIYSMAVLAIAHFVMMF
ncbi:MAG: hypothetical protein FWF88_03930 [Peptococcaceae bacterium]|nr:hypothetical protein [Peptococcaceae bacterium]